MTQGYKTGGRRKGTPNKTTMIAKQAIAEAAEELGGVDRLVAWVREEEQNERVFWGTIYPKLLPLQVEGGDNPINVVARIERSIVDVNNPNS